MASAMKLMSRRKIDFAPGEDTWGLKVIREDYETASGGKKTYWKYSLPDTALVVALTTDGKIISIEEFQPGVGATYPHLVGGTVDEGEEPHATARRELLEETGYRADDVRLLSTMAHDSGRSDRKVLLYLATDCRKVAEPETGISVSLLEPREFWKKFLGYLLANPEKMHGGANSLKAAALALAQLGYLCIVDA